MGKGTHCNKRCGRGCGPIQYSPLRQLEGYPVELPQSATLTLLIGLTVPTARAYPGLLLYTTLRKEQYFVRKRTHRDKRCGRGRGPIQYSPLRQLEGYPVELPRLTTLTLLISLTVPTARAYPGLILLLH